MSGSSSETAASPAVDILLATYNGATYLAEQIDSILAQTYRSWRVLARDDGSADDTVTILRRYAERHPDRFVLLVDGDGNLGCNGNFTRLAEHSDAGYLALCDQDDVWLPDKLAVSMDRMLALERAHGQTTPLLVHTDLEIADGSLGTIDRSFWRYQGLRPGNGGDLARLLVHNVVTGCATVMNRSLMKRALPIPREARIHDWWIALVASAFGIVDAIPEATLLYRQHDRNVIGARAYGGWRFWVRAWEFLQALPSRRADLLATWRQAQAFLARYGDALQPGDRTLLRDVQGLPGRGMPTRMLRAIRHGGLPPEGLYWLAFALFLPTTDSRHRSAPAEESDERPLEAGGHGR